MGHRWLLALSAIVLAAFLILIDRERRALRAEGLVPTAPGIVDDQIRTAARALLDEAPAERPLGTLVVSPPREEDAPASLAVTLSIPRAPESPRPPLSLGPFALPSPRAAIEIARITLQDPWFPPGDPHADRPLFVWTRILPEHASGIPVEDPSRATPVFYRLAVPVLRHYDREIWTRLAECLRDSSIAAAQGVAITRHVSDVIDLAPGQTWILEALASGEVRIRSRTTDSRGS